MATKLRTFQTFAAAILPHEGQYLAQAGRFEHPDNQAILETLVHNTQAGLRPRDFDPEIDKRKYSRVKQWVQSRLDAIDVDQQYGRITHFEQQILLDNILPEEERQLLRMLRNYQQPTYYFMKLYDLAEHYRQYLLVRMRHRAYRDVNDFLLRQIDAYHRAKTIYTRLHQATLDITRQYTDFKTESQQWEKWLLTVFDDPTVDGLNRYTSAVRLTFLYLNYRQFDSLLELFQRLDACFASGLFYSRRILANYYGNCLLLYSRMGNLSLAAHYGYLSIRQSNADFFHYLHNLCAVLLRQGQHQDTLALIEQYRADIRSSPSGHTKVSFAALSIRALFADGQLTPALRYADRFLRGYQDEVLSQRWHSFFSAYFQVLLKVENYDKMIRCGTRHKLLAKEQQYQQGTGHLPILSWYLAVARYKEGRIQAPALQQELIDNFPTQALDEQQLRQMQALWNELEAHIPLIMKSLSPSIRKSVWPV